MAETIRVAVTGAAGQVAYAMLGRLASGEIFGHDKKIILQMLEIPQALQRIDPERIITDVGVDEISLKKGHRLYATVLTDLTEPTRPRVLAVGPGRDQAAAEACLQRLTTAQRDAVRTHRTDMSPAFTAACAAQLKHSQQVIDRFHVAKKLGEVVDEVRKKTRAANSAGGCSGRVLWR